MKAGYLNECLVNPKTKVNVFVRRGEKRETFIIF